ncbi:MAG: alanine racemase [Pseudomonadales bacterium]|nr:alanine racemase [Pseudomonadales bacterium]MCP5184866.1 alanine racemase [Pseudomonadales bacterium]
MTDSLVLDTILQRSWEPVILPVPLPVTALPTPALVLDRAAMSRNVSTMAAHLHTRQKKARPHAKTHKCPLIARLQLEHGAVGICAAKLGEAAALVAAGVRDILLTSPLTHPVKIELLARLLRRASGLWLVVDSEEGMRVLEAGIPADCRLGIVLDIDVDMGRTGCRQPEVARRILDRVDSDPRFHLAGIQHYAGHLMHIREFAERRERSLASWSQALSFARQVLPRLPGVVTGGGSGTYAIDVDVDEITDLQVGSYLFMDSQYMEIQSLDGDNFNDFENSLQVACTVISDPLRDVGAVTVDGGFKAFASDAGAPRIRPPGQGKYRFAGDEHGVYRVPEGDQAPALGDVLRFIVPHCDPTVNLHDVYWVMDPDGVVRELWPITARGASW